MDDARKLSAGSSLGRLPGDGSRIDGEVKCGTHRGHEIVEASDGVWLYADTRQPVAKNPERPCGYCGKANTLEGHDGCIGTLPGVINACCGHGITVSAYVQLGALGDVRGEEAVKLQAELRALGNATRHVGGGEIRPRRSRSATSLAANGTPSRRESAMKRFSGLMS